MTYAAGMSEFIGTATHRGVRTLTLDRPHRRNALSSAMITQLREGLAAAVADSAIRVVVLDHTGPAFCSGVDLTETETAAKAATAPAPDTAGSSPAADGDAEAARLPAELLPELLADLWECPKPVVARVAGPARAGGLGLLAAADLVVCAADATFAFTEVRLGVTPAVISATVLRRIGRRAAARYLLTGEVFDGATAAAIGLVTEAVPAAEVDATVAAWCDALVRGAPAALAATKDLLRRPVTNAIRAELAELAEVSATFFRSAQAREGMAAARAARDPDWVP